jgi:predicted outer membrane repeat protein
MPPLRRALALGLFTLLLAAGANAATITWTGAAGDGLWHTAANWDLARIPGAGDDVLIPNLAGTASVTHGANITTSVNSLACSEPFVMPTGRLILAAASSFAAGLDLNNATIDGAGDIAITGPGFDWHTGNIEGTGTLVISPGVTWTMSGVNLSSRPFLVRPCDNFGSLVITHTSGMTVAGGGIFRNRTGGSVDWRADGLIQCNGGFENFAGATFTRSIATGLALLQGGTFGSAGTVNIQSGTLEFNFITTTQNGSVTVSPGAVVSFGGTNATFTAGSSLTVNGTLAFSSFSNVTLDPAMAALTLPTVSMPAGGSLSVGPNVSIESLSLLSGTLTGAGNVTVTNSFQWNDGTLGGTGTFTIAPGLAWTCNGIAEIQRNVDNFGTGVIARRLRVVSPAVFRNRAGATLDLRSDDLLDGFGSVVNDSAASLVRSTGTGTFTMQAGLLNAGTVRVLTGTLQLVGSVSNAGFNTLIGGTWEVTGTLRYNFAAIVTNAATIVMDGPAAAIRNTFDDADALAGLAANAAGASLVFRNGASCSASTAFTNAGAVTVGPGASTFTALLDYVQGGGSTTLAGGTLATAHFHLDGGVLMGSGTVNGSVVNAATLAPGQSPGSITVTGDYTQTSAGTLQVELAGKVPGSEFDRVVVAGAATLGGALQVSQLAPFSAALGDSFEILAAGTLAGGFESLNGTLAIPGGCLVPVVRDTALRLLGLQDPAIVLPPASQGACAGETVAFTVGVTGGVLSFQWRKDHVNIPGATASTLLLAAAALADSGSYDVVVTGGCVQVTSAAALLTVSDCLDTLFVDAAAAPGGDGGSWATAFQRLEQAVAVSGTGRNYEIWVARGTYRVPSTPYALRPRNQIYGGLASGATQRETRDRVANETVLTGDSLGNDGPNFTNRSDNHGPIFRSADHDSTSLLDGFTLRGGEEHGATGGALYLSGNGPGRIANCVFTDNSAVNGGAVRIERAPSAGAKITFDDCTFNGNRARASGGAVFGGAFMNRCRFVRNYAGVHVAGHGGALFVNGGGRYTDCSFTGNETHHVPNEVLDEVPLGGAVYVNIVGIPEFVRCAFDSNGVSAYQPMPRRGGGGAVAVFPLINSVSAKFDGCSFFRNSVSGSDSLAGGAMFCGANSSVLVTNSRFIGNTADSSAAANGGAIEQVSTLSLNLMQCLFERNSATGAGGAIHASTTSQPGMQVLGSTIADNTCGGPSGAGVEIENCPGNSTVVNSILYGNTGSVPAGAPETQQLHVVNSAAPLVSFSSIQGLTGTFGGTGNVDGTPAFVSPAGADQVPGTLDDDFRLGSGSACVDRGKNSAFPAGSLSAFDLAGLPRFVDDACRPDSGLGAAPQIDLGAYEFQGTSCTTTAVGDETPSGVFLVRAPYPNPSRGSATLSFQLPKRGRVVVEVFDVAGRRVAGVLDRELPAGSHVLALGAAGGGSERLAAGFYTLRVSAAGQTATRALVVLK